MFRRWKVLFAVCAFLGANLVLLLAMPATRSQVASYSEWLMSANERGFVKRVHIDQSGTERKYVVYVPQSTSSDQPIPLLMFLHGFSGNGSDGINHIHECLGPVIWEQRDEFPFIVLFPQCPEGSTWLANDVAGGLAMELLEKTEAEYGTDPDRVFLTGVSSGADGTWSIATQYPNRFAAVIPISGTGPGDAAAELLADSNLPIWNFYVHGDKERLVESNREMQKSMLQHGASPFSTELDGTLSEQWWTHDAWSYAYGSRATFAWLLNQRRSQNSLRAKRFKLIADQNLSNWTETGDASWMMTEDSVIVCSTDGRPSEVTGAISYEGDSPNFELHLDFRCDGPQVCEFTFGEEQIKGDRTGWQLRVVSRDHGSGGLFNLSNGECVQPGNPIAQGSFKDKNWNDLRIAFKDSELTVHLNGWKLIDLKDQQLGPRVPRLSLIAGSDPSARKSWRHVRIREITP